VVATEGGTLEEKYNALNKELERSEDRAKEIHDRVKAVKDVADDLFKEWRRSLASTRTPAPRGERARLRETKRRAQQVIKADGGREKRVILSCIPLRDRVLFLKTT